MRKIQLDTVLSTSELAELLMISPRRVTQLAAIGAIAKHGRDKFLVSEALPSYLEFRRDPAIRRLVMEQAGDFNLSDFDD